MIDARAIANTVSPSTTARRVGGGTAERSRANNPPPPYNFPLVWPALHPALAVYSLTCPPDTLAWLVRKKVFYFCTRLPRIARRAGYPSFSSPPPTVSVTYAAFRISSLRERIMKHETTAMDF